MLKNIIIQTFRYMGIALIVFSQVKLSFILFKCFSREKIFFKIVPLFASYDILVVFLFTAKALLELQLMDRRSINYHIRCSLERE